MTETAQDQENDGIRQTQTYGVQMLTEDIYVNCYWSQLERAVTQLLAQEPGVFIRLSYEQMYSCVYKCVCHQYSERMYGDLRRVLTGYLQEKAVYLQMCNSSEFCKRFHTVLKQYTQALGGIVPIFTFLNRFYITQKLGMELRPELEKLFIQHLQTHIFKVLGMLHEAQAKPFSVDPSIASDIIHGLYEIKQDYAELNPGLFAKYIPSILPPCNVENLSDYIAETHQMQTQLLSQEDFNRDNQSQKKRSNDAEAVVS
ncbi:CDK2-associated and cullin domain-containing protein 1-like isoform X2 [Acanthaster planci]|uniref:CDK2-associated and cullin domain-containing protein 1-like isoform X2 n=1 Tax=Acanthaster planci TaxID=133434 RepID=A0A8B7YJY9_ACAPL|nr:CDK2-associated and cullin domain-containing protein 1-like isoform X2 [Acanthaster planci]